MSIPVIDIFAGPGGLGEGFSSLFENEKRIFKTVLSIEMDNYAHETLTLRSFYRQFHPDNVPEDYYNFLRGDITKENLFEEWPEEAKAAKLEAWNAKLGYDEKSEDPEEVDRKIRNALAEDKEWVLIGGPPCQAYSVVGRSRRKNNVLDASEDERVDLYKQYLRILAVHSPQVFVMENVKGLLSARTKKDSVFEKIMHDLKKPASAFSTKDKENTSGGYKIYSLVVPPESLDLEENPLFEPEDFVIRCEEYGIPQTRHRVILLGIRNDLEVIPETLEKRNKRVPLSAVLNKGFPRLRSGLSKTDNTDENWKNILSELPQNGVLDNMETSVAQRVKKTVKNLRIPQKGTGGNFIPYTRTQIEYEREWFDDEKLKGVCNHEARGHMNSDLHRYLFLSSYAKEFKTSPTLSDFPKGLLPDHKNVKESLKTKKFVDRFRVQLENKPAKTITSHISKDGHYYIHPDPTQCRSLTVREAARIQTFPDNYFFCGPRTSQYIQVGNAVPPLLAKKIAKIVSDIFKKKR
jgi:DNA (cytosine-5)-methyltransferase 1